jgi:hypothetical protein
MTSALGLKLQEAIEANEARKAMAQWNQPTQTTMTTSVSEATFNMVRDNPGKTKSQLMELLNAQGYKPTSTTSLLSSMVRYGILIQAEDKTLTAVGTTYKPRVEFLGKRKVTKRKKIIMIKKASDPVNHPAHYKVGGIETIDFIEAKQLNYNIGNVVKYITRADHKGNQLQDLQKAQWYLAREIERLQA